MFGVALRLNHYNGVANTVPSKVSLAKGKGFSISIKNLDTLNVLEISFNSGRSFYPIAPGGELQHNGSFHFFFVRSIRDELADVLANVLVVTDAILSAAYTQAGGGAGATLTDDGVGILTVDGVALSAANRVLVKNGAGDSDNGIYTVTTAGTGIVNPTPETGVELVTVAALPAYTQAGAGAGATLTADGVGVLTVDGVATVLNDRILVKDGAAGSDNGIYEVTTEGTGGVPFVLTRVADHDEDAEVTSGDWVIPASGAEAGNKFQISTLDPIVVDTTSVTWVEVFSYVLTRAGDHDEDAEVTSGDFVTADAGGAVNGELTFQITTDDPITVDTTDVTWAQLGSAFAALVAEG